MDVSLLQYMFDKLMMEGMTSIHSMCHSKVLSSSLCSLWCRNVYVLYTNSFQGVHGYDGYMD